MKVTEVIYIPIWNEFETVLHSTGVQKISSDLTSETADEYKIWSVIIHSFKQTNLSQTTLLLLFSTVSSTTLLDYAHCNGIFLSMNCESYRSFIQQRLCGELKLKSVPSVISLVNICLHTHTYAQRPRGSTVRHGMHWEWSVCWCGLLV